METPVMPCHIGCYAFATGQDVAHDPRYGWIVRDGDMGAEVPDFPDDRWLSECLVGVTERHGWEVKTRYQKGFVVILRANLGMGEAVGQGDGPDLPSALCAAIAKAREVGNGNL